MQHISFINTARATKQPRKRASARATLRVIYYRGLTLLARTVANAFAKLAGDS